MHCAAARGRRRRFGSWPLQPAQMSRSLSAQVLGRRVRGCEWHMEELPRCDALCALRLWAAMLECQAVREGEALHCGDYRVPRVVWEGPPWAWEPAEAALVG